MERAAKRQKLSEDSRYAPTRTINLAEFQRPQYVRRRNIPQNLAPRRPDVTVSAAIVEVNVNDASTAVQVSLSTGNAAVTLSGLGTLTVPAVEEPSSSASATPGSSGSSSSSSRRTASSSTSSNLAQTSALFPSSNSTSLSSTSTERTITVTATSTFHVSYYNGTFIVPTTTSHRKTASTGTSSDDSDGDDDSSSSDSNSDSTTYVFGQDVTDTYTSAGATGAVTGGSAYNNNGAIAATATNSSPSSSSSSGNGSGGSGGGIAPLTPQQTQMVGGIVGGVAGIAFVLVIILYVLRWYRQRLKLQGRLPEQLTSGTDHSFHSKAALAGMAAPISQRSINASRTSLFPVAAGLKKWRGSDMTFLSGSTSQTAADSEKGFQRVSGRKIPSVLTHGGDQYGGSYGAFEKESGVLTQARSFTPQKHNHRHDLSETSFYRDEDGMHIGTGLVSHSAPSSPIYPPIFTEKPRRPSQPTQSSPLSHSNSSRRDFAMDDFNHAFNQNMANMAGISKPDGFAISRNSPARTPVIQSPTTSSLRLPIQAPVTMDEDVPEMPLPSPGLVLGQGQGNGMSGLTLGHDLARQRMPLRLSARSGSSSTRFREDLS